jgi:hypothetical protein
MRDKAVTSSRDGRDVSYAVLAIAERFAQGANRNPKAAVTHHDTGPRSTHQLALSNDLTCGLDKCDQDI